MNTIGQTLEATHRCVLQAEVREVEETHAFAAQVAPSLQAGGMLLLIGPLGAGKTTFVQGLTRALGYHGRAKSPSFVLQQIYKLPTLTIEHWDLYRLLYEEGTDGEEVLREIGTVGDLVLIEWGEALLERSEHEDASLLVIEPRTDGLRRFSYWVPISDKAVR